MASVGRSCNMAWMAREAAGAMSPDRDGTDPRARVDAARVARTFPIMISWSRYRMAGHCARLLLLCAVGACDRDKSITVSGNVPGLDTLGFRADSLLAQAERGPAPAGELATTAGQAMSLRAQARGDSMARAGAQRLAGGGDLSGRSRGDSVRGVVTLVGAEPARQIVLRAAGNNIALSGMVTSGLGRLAGTEVVVRGVKITARDIVVSDFLVRASDGVPAWDGTLEARGTLRLTDGSGRKRLPSVPVGLRSMIGARVWVAFKPGSATAASYGIIDRR